VTTKAYFIVCNAVTSNIFLILLAATRGKSVTKFMEAKDKAYFRKKHLNTKI